MEFNELGGHCSSQYCHQKDFLPFNCKFCSKSFCLEHRSPFNHNCENKSSTDNMVFLCPICNGGIRILPGEDYNELVFYNNLKI